MFRFGRKSQEEELEAVSKVGREVGREIEAQRRPLGSDAAVEDRVIFDALSKNEPRRRMEQGLRDALAIHMKRAQEANSL